MKIIFYSVGENPVVKNVDTKLKTLQNLVGGYIETFSQPDGVIIVCNEEGKLIGLPINRIMFNEPIAGNFFICRSDGEDFSDVTEEDIERFIVNLSLK